MTSFETLQSRLNTKYIPGLDGLRAVAVLLVIFYHFGFLWVPGGHGVMIFFVLSGFLITWLLLKESDQKGFISLKGFYYRRALRIFPAFYVYWLLVEILQLVTHKQLPWARTWSTFFYVRNYYNAFNPHAVDAFSHTWSLGIEEQFYLFWPVLFVLWRRNLQRMTSALLAMIGFVWVYRALLCLMFDVNQNYIYYAFDTRIDQLLVGCLLGVLLKRGSLKPVWNVACAHPALPLVTVGVLLASIVLGPEYVYRYRDVFGFSFEPLLVAILIVQAVGLTATYWWRPLNSGIMQFLGRISYPLYLYQQVTLYPVRRILADYSILTQLGAALCVTVGVALTSYYVVERPFLKLKDRKLIP